jgi:tRNA U54 and U55 pseudouridine synthase Pus10
MSDSRKNIYETLEDSALIEMALGTNVVDRENAYEDMLIEKLSLEKIKSEIDRTTGAPSNVRFSVGAAQSPEDKLATQKTEPWNLVMATLLLPIPKQGS